MMRTELYALLKKSGGRMVDFAGWELPVQFSGVMEEHRAVREAAGLFDVSHMGEVEVWGPGAGEACQAITPNDVRTLRDGDAQYTALLNERGGFIDDVILYRLAADRYFICVNAVNAEKDYEWIKERVGDRAEVGDRSQDYAQIALQGPKAEEILRPLCTVDLGRLSYYQSAEGEVLGARTLIARTGYTGEDGFELFVAPENAETVWTGIMDRGAPLGLLPAGLGARDTLRLEMGYPLYGHELDETTTPLDANLEWIVKMAKGDFIGRAPLEEEKKRGLTKALIGLEMTEPGVPRQGYPVIVEGKPAGAVTSGTFSPSLGKGIAMAYVGFHAPDPGAEIGVKVRGRVMRARVVHRPFYPSHVKRRKRQARS